MPKCRQCGTEFWIGNAEYCIDCKEQAEANSRREQHASIILTTTIDVPNRQIEKVVSIIAAESAVGLNIFKDIANNWRDFFGGRSATSESALRDVRSDCLTQLRTEAGKVGADAVIAVSFHYNQLNTSGTGGILFVAATGTAVKLKAEQID
jgi:uncharacterized protein YbjQ (UPF0145 family)